MTETIHRPPTVRVEVGDQWAEVKDLKRINFGEVRRLRVQSATGEADASIAVAASCVVEWNGVDHQSGEPLGPCTLDTLDRVSPAFGLAICTAVSEGLSGTLPLASKAESPTS